jgi:hypothetical protein
VDAAVPFSLAYEVAANKLRIEQKIAAIGSRTEVKRMESSQETDGGECRVDNAGPIVVKAVAVVCATGMQNLAMCIDLSSQMQINCKSDQVGGW